MTVIARCIPRFSLIVLSIFTILLANVITVAESSPRCQEPGPQRLCVDSMDVALCPFKL